MKTLFAVAVAVSLLTGTSATAYADDGRDRGRHHDRGDRDHGRHDGRGRYDNDRRHNGWNRRDAYRAGYVHGRVDQRRFDRGRYIAPRGFHHRHWRHGDRLPRAYYSSSYIVHDYHVYHLRRPPHGHHWVRVNNDVVLAAVASGLVVSVVNGLFH
jgi:Ni/Co efflux regulator RcnB